MLFFRAAEAQNSGRIALVIGNASYAGSPLPFARNDATAMAEALKRDGFAVTRALDLNSVDMQRTIESFAHRTARANVVVFYFAGHGVQSSNAKNYLLPIDIDPKSKEDTIEGGVEVESLFLRRFSSPDPQRITIVILDACRSPPLSRSSSDIPFASNRVGGLAKMLIPSGSFVAYGAQPGSWAVEDPNSRHGRFTGALLKHIETPGLTIEQVFKRTRTCINPLCNTLLRLSCLQMLAKISVTSSEGRLRT
jgi:uncharacterized caspase-like protein